MLIQIDGWHGAGKGIIWSLLDGHKDIFVVPIHEASYFPLLSDNNEYWLKNKDIVELRKRLSMEGYYYFEKFYNQNYYYIHLSVTNIMNIKYKVDFYKFDNLFINRVMALNEWTIEGLINLLYTTYYELYTNNLICPRYIASMGVPRKRNFENELKLYSNTKCIVVKRDIKNIIATNTKRINQKNQILNSDFKNFIKSHIPNIIDYYEQYEYIAKKYPNNFYIVKFEDLILDTTMQMQEIAKFLDIEFDNILTVPTRDGVLLEQNGESFIKKENDIAENLLSKEELALIDIFLKQKSMFNTNLSKNIPIAHSISKIVEEVYRLKVEDILSQEKLEFIETFLREEILFNRNLSENISITHNISKIFKEVHMIKQKYNKIIIYGNGYLGQAIVPFLSQRVVGVIDKYSQFSNESYNMVSINNLNEIEYDIIVITVLGREYEIVKELINIGVDIDKIVELFHP